MPNEARIRLSVDTAGAQKDVKILDKQIKELGGSGNIDIGSGSMDSIKDLITSQQKLVESIEKSVESMDKNTRLIISRLENMKTSVNRSLQNDAENVYQKKLDELEARKKMMETGLVPYSGGSGGGGGTGSGSLPALPGSGGDGSKLLKLLGNLGTLATALGALKGVYSYASAGAKNSIVSELRTYQVYNTSGYYDNDFSSGRNSIAKSGARYGYNVSDTLSVQDTLMGMMGVSTVDKSQADSNSILSAARALGIDEGMLAYTAGSSFQKGTYDVGNMNKFTNLFASSVKSSGMTGREDEQLEVLQSIQELLGKNLTTISEGQMTNTLGLYSLLANANANLKGSAGASAISSINEGITNGDYKMDLLLGWGTQYKGVAGKWALEQAKEQGISNPDNLRNVFQNFERFTGQSIDSDYGKLVLKNLFGVDTETIDTLVSKRDEILSGSYSDELKNLIEDETGSKVIESELKDYTNDTALSEGVRYQVETENAQDRVGDTVNEFTGPLKGLYNSLPSWMQSGLGVAGSAAKGGLQAFGIYKIFDILKNGFGGSGAGSFFKNLFGSGSSTSGTTGSSGGFFSNLFKGKSSGGTTSTVMDDAIDVLYKVLDEAGNVVEEFVPGVNGLDDTGRVLANSGDEILEAGSKILGSSDDIARAGSAGLKGLSKAGGKALGIAGIVLEAGLSAYDAYKAHERDDNREMFQEIGGGVGGIAGGAGGAWAGAAAGAAIGSVVPGIGNVVGGVIGAIIGGIGGGVAGDKLGEAAGEGIYDATSGENYNFTSEQAKQIKEYYDTAKKLYEEEGNNAAQDFTNETIVPYLNSIGVSTSRTDDYKRDVGKPDFIKDYEKGIYGVADSQDELKESIDELNETLKNENVRASSYLGGVGAGASGEFIAANSMRDKLNTTGTVDTTADTEYVSSSSTTSAKSSGGIWSWFKGLFGFGSNAVGKDYIPYDGYISELHKGEAILSAHEANEWRKSSLRNAMKPEISESIGVSNAVSSQSSGLLEIKLSGSIDGMTESNQSEIVRAVVNIIQSTNGANAIMSQLGTNHVRYQN